MNRRDLVLGALSVAGVAALDACSSGSKGGALAPASVPASVPSLATSAPSTSVPSVAAPITSTDAPVAPPATATSVMSTVAWAPGGPASYVRNGPASSPVAALTFHFAGDPGLATQLLDLLASSGVTSTLFAIGGWITAHPALARRALADGHELGNHTKSHQNMLQLSAGQVHAEIEDGAKELVPFLGSIGRWFRPSGTDVPSQTILDEAGKVGYPVSVGYDIDSRDYTEPGSRAVVANVVPALHPGAIVSLHFGHRDTIVALPSILSGMDAAGLRHATITELLG